MLLYRSRSGRYTGGLRTSPHGEGWEVRYCCLRTRFTVQTLL